MPPQPALTDSAPSQQLPDTLPTLQCLDEELLPPPRPFTTRSPASWEAA